LSIAISIVGSYNATMQAVKTDNALIRQEQAQHQRQAEERWAIVIGKLESIQTTVNNTDKNVAVLNEKKADRKFLN